MKSPIARKDPVTISCHGTRSLSDDYAWMRQKNWKEMFADTSLLDAEIRDYLEAENAYTEQAFFEPQKELIDTLVEEMKQRVDIFYDSAGYIDGPYRYFARYSDQDYPVFLRQDVATGREEILLDVNAEFAVGGQKVFLKRAQHSPDHKYFAVMVDFTGSENFTIKIKNIASGEFLADEVTRTGDMEWGKDGSTLYYVRFCDDPDKFYHDRVFMHRLGETQEQDTLVYHELDQGFHMSLDETSSGRFIGIRLSSKDSTEIRMIDLENPDQMPVMIAGRENQMIYEVDHGGDRFYIRHNGAAIDYKIVTAPVATPTPEHWVDLVPHREGYNIREHKVFANHLVYLGTEKFLPQIVVMDLTTNENHVISFDDPAYDVQMGNARGYDSTVLRLVYTSPRTPTRFYDYDMGSRERILLRQEKIDGHDPENYVVERIFIPTHDGKAMPLTITRHKDTKLDGSAPMRLYGYGSYGSSLSSTFGRVNYRYTLINRGFICVDAHIRGGGELGRQWYLDGKMLNKRHTFMDFIGAAEWLVANHYTSKGKIAIEGASAGGMLMGAVANMAPEGLFGCMVAAVPFVDVMNTMMDEELPLTPPEWTEWGNPITDASAFDYMLSYSPYDNVTEKPYPPMLITGGLTDPRVTYWEPAKWAAKLRDKKTDTNPLYLHIAMDSGHGGDPGRFGHLPELAQSIAFMLNHVGK